MYRLIFRSPCTLVIVRALHSRVASLYCRPMRAFLRREIISSDSLPNVSSGDRIFLDSEKSSVYHLLHIVFRVSSPPIIALLKQFTRHIRNKTVAKKRINCE